MQGCSLVKPQNQDWFASFLGNHFPLSFTLHVWCIEHQRWSQKYRWPKTRQSVESILQQDHPTTCIQGVPKPVLQCQMAKGHEHCCDCGITKIHLVQKSALLHDVVCLNDSFLRTGAATCECQRQGPLPAHTTQRHHPGHIDSSYQVQEICCVNTNCIAQAFLS